MGCNCGKRRLAAATTSANLTAQSTSQNDTGTQAETIVANARQTTVNTELNGRRRT